MSILEDKLKQSMQGDDSFLYHYTSLSSACKIFENRSLKLSNLTNTVEIGAIQRVGSDKSGHWEIIGK